MAPPASRNGRLWPKCTRTCGTCASPTVPTKSTGWSSAGTKLACRNLTSLMTAKMTGGEPPAGHRCFASQTRESNMEYAPADLTPRESYKILTSFVLPRPIAWVTTVGPTGVVNAAPFSFFNVFCEDPPLCMSAANLLPDGRVKDTLVNIQRSGEFVVNIADEPLARAMHDSSGDFPPEIGEPGYLGLKLPRSTKCRVPRLADAPWAMECKTWKTIDVNGDRQLIMGEGIKFYILDQRRDDTSMLL